jgi:hypothetical protein
MSARDLIVELFPVVLAIYAIDCLARVRPFSILLVSQRGKRYRYGRAGLRLAGVLPGARTFRVSGAPILVAPEAAYVPLQQGLRTSERFRREAYIRLDYAEIPSVDVDDTAVAVGQYSVPYASGSEAAATASLIRRLGELPRDQRAAVVERERGRAFSRDRAGRVLQAFELRCRALRELGWMFFGVAFVATPLAGYLWPWTLAPLVALNTAIFFATIVALVAARRGIRRAGLLPRDGTLASTLMAPPIAVRAAVNLGKDIFSGYDALAVGALLLPKEQLARLARVELHGVEVAISQREDADWMKFWSDRQSRILKLLHEAGVLEEARRAPEKQDPAAEAFCPECESEFVAGVADCPDCGWPLLRHQRSAGRGAG